LRPLFEQPGVPDRVNGEPIPQLATDWDFSADATTWTWNLRENVPFHFDWGEFTSADLRHMIEMTTREDSAGSETTTHKNLASVQTPDDHTIIVVQSVPNIFILPFHWFGFRGNVIGMSKDYWDAEGIEGYREKPVGTGSYRFVSATAGQGIKYERVEDHWRHTPEFEELEQLFTGEAATRMAMLLADEAHIADIPRDLQKTLADGGMTIAESSITSITMAYAFGGSHFDHAKMAAAGYDMTTKKHETFPVIDDEYIKVSPWTDPVNGKLVREAINRAIDRDEIQETLFRGAGTLMLAQGFHPTVPGWNPQWETDFPVMYGFDLPKAKDLLAQAGYTDPSEITIKIMAYERFGTPENVPLALVIADYMKDLGLTVEFEQRDSALRSKLQRERALQGHLAVFLGGYRDVEFTWSSRWSTNGGASSYESIQTWELYDELIKTITPEGRHSVTKELGDHLFYEYAEIPIINLKATAVINPKVVAEYVFPGNIREIHSHLEYVKAANLK
jgi:ABC-type transport system substrate-binding protein